MLKSLDERLLIEAFRLALGLTASLTLRESLSFQGRPLGLSHLTVF